MRRRAAVLRIIPAGAGSTSGGRACPHTRADHPRGRGEHSTGLRLVRSCRRIIPAGAGSTSQSPPDPCSRTDHPRGRGEHGGTYFGSCGGCGSSPRARGARDGGRLGHRLSPDHPRGRGEHKVAGWVLAMLNESSPRARGAHLLSCDDAATVGHFASVSSGTTRRHQSFLRNLRRAARRFQTVSSLVDAPSAGSPGFGGLSRLRGLPGM